jgi:hypothetical protein
MNEVWCPQEDREYSPDMLTNDDLSAQVFLLQTLCVFSFLSQMNEVWCPREDREYSPDMLTNEVMDDSLF